jgi:hypothetical protein
MTQKSKKFVEGDIVYSIATGDRFKFFSYITVEFKGVGPKEIALVAQEKQHIGRWVTNTSLDRIDPSLLTKEAPLTASEKKAEELKKTIAELELKVSTIKQQNVSLNRFVKTIEQGLKPAEMGKLEDFFKPGSARYVVRPTGRIFEIAKSTRELSPCFELKVSLSDYSKQLTYRHTMNGNTVEVAKTLKEAKEIRAKKLISKLGLDTYSLQNAFGPNEDIEEDLMKRVIKNSITKLERMVGTAIKNLEANLYDIEILERMLGEGLPTTISEYQERRSKSLDKDTETFDEKFPKLAILKKEYTNE